jgi:hypothetical protein
VKITFGADHVQVRGPSQVSGNVTISFTTGEYEWDKIMQLPLLNGAGIYVTVSKENPSKEDANVR